MKYALFALLAALLSGCATNHVHRDTETDEIDQSLVFERDFGFFKTGGG